MTLLPSEHATEIVSNPSSDLYLSTFHPHVEQSAIYRGILFTAVDEKDFGIVLTSQCDIQNNTANNHLLVARIVPVGEFFAYWVHTKNGYTVDEAYGKALPPKDKPQRGRLVREFADNYLKNQTMGYHFLPEIKEIMKGSLICFDITECMMIKDIASQEKIAVLKSPFRESVPAHYSAYAGRIGTPAIERKYLRTVVDDQCTILQT